MPQLAVFFASGAGFGIEKVQVLDAAHAQNITRAQRQTGRLSAGPAEQRGQKELIPKLGEEILVQISVPLSRGSFIDPTCFPADPRHRATSSCRPHLSKQS